MKRSIAILLGAALLTLLLSGCGEMKTDRPAVSATPIPETTLIPEEMMPDPEDGVVNDGDGVIEPGDNGTQAGADKGNTAGGGNSDNGNTGSSADSKRSTNMR